MAHNVRKTRKFMNQYLGAMKRADVSLEERERRNDVRNVGIRVSGLQSEYALIPAVIGMVNVK